MRLFTFVIALLAGADSLKADDVSPTRLTWNVSGQEREALVFLPQDPNRKTSPLVFVFHGHGGSMKLSSRLGFAKLWPEAIVACPQGLPTATARDPQGARSGWQPRVGVNDDRDLKFFDAMVKTFREQSRADPDRIYATGHSNGGGFTYLLGAMRSGELAAIAPSAAGLAGAARSDAKPIPVLHLAGRNDEIVPFDKQQKSMQWVRLRNGCEEQSQPWAKAGELEGVVYPSRTGALFVAVLHDGTHKYPDQAPELIVRFFKEHPKATPKSAKKDL